MRHDIWNNDVNEMAESLQKEEERYLTMDPDELYDAAYEQVEINLEADIENLNIEVPGEIILIGDLVRWNGSYGVHRCLGTRNIGEAIKASLGCFGNGDNSFEIYVEDGQLMISQLGHDNPTKHSVMKLRTLTKDYWDIDEHSTESLLAISKELGPEVAKVFGWEVAA